MELIKYQLCVLNVKCVRMGYGEQRRNPFFYYIRRITLNTKSPFKTPLQEYIYLDKYSRFNYDLGRREQWSETVDRTVSHLRGLTNDVDFIDWDEIHQAIFNLDVMPSMRNLAMAGAAAERSSIVSYNCSYAPVADVLSFREAVVILMSGSGLGYSVESRYIKNLPPVKIKKDSTIKYTVEDTSDGWATAVHLTIESLLDGVDVDIDYSSIRAAGTPLKVKGGRASGPEHLEKGIEAIKSVIGKRAGKNLRSLDVHDIMCHIAEAIVSGGVRRSAMIALFDYDDELMRSCKDGDKMVGNEQRWLSNNSVVIEDEMTFEDVDTIMRDMADGGSGEPGLFSRYVANQTKPARRDECDFGLNPCSEIMLRPYQFCNLSSIVCRPEDTLSKLLLKTRIATTIGTVQSMASNFPSLRPEWKINAEKERLLGVDLNGIMDSELARHPETLKTLRNYAVLINKLLAEKLGINQSAAVTCVKPSGNSSVLLDTSAGLHTRWNDYYIRRVSTDATNPLMQLMIDSGVPVEKKIGSKDTYVVSFPIKAPDGAITRKDLSAIEQCEVWKNLKVNYTEHNPSVTITYNEDELDEMITWVFRNQSVISGMAFLPSFDAQYDQMPYEDIDKKTYQEIAGAMPNIDFGKIAEYEKGIDTTNVSATFACSSDKCIMPVL